MTGQTRMLFIGRKGWKDQVTGYRYFSKADSCAIPKLATAVDRIVKWLLAPSIYTFSFSCSSNFNLGIVRGFC